MQREEITLHEPSEQEFADGGFSVLVPARGGREAADLGMTAHRGTLVGDEYIDPFVLRAEVEQALGHSYEDVSSVYRQGPLAAEQRQLRDRIDSRLLALSRSGGSMTTLAKVLDMSEKTVDRALARARQVEVKPIVSKPAVRTRAVSFITGLEGAAPRRRRHAGCPDYMIPEEQYRYSTVNLTDEEYARGNETRLGNPAYWEHRLATSPIKNGVKPGPARPKQTFPADWPSDESYALFLGD